MEKITKKQFIQEMEKSNTYFQYAPSVRFNEFDDFKSFMSNDAKKMTAFLLEKLKYHEFLECIKNMPAEDFRTVVKVQSDGSLKFSNGGWLTMTGFGKKSFFRHTTDSGKYCLCCISVWGDDSLQNIQCLSYFIK